MKRLLLLLPVLALLVAPMPAHAAPPQDRKVPTEAQWLTDVHTAMKGARAYVKHRAASGDPQLALNFDIDNTVLATYYEGGGPIPEMLKFVTMAKRHGVSIFFNTGRVASMYDSTLAQLTGAGFPVDKLCLRAQGATLPHGKQACRQGFADGGYTLIADVGNNTTDFVGGGYERAFKLPNYGGALG